jgi:hypothetical protein
LECDAGFGDFGLTLCPWLVRRKQTLQQFVIHGFAQKPQTPPIQFFCTSVLSEQGFFKVNHVFNLALFSVGCQR